MFETAIDHSHHSHHPPAKLLAIDHRWTRSLKAVTPGDDSTRRTQSSRQAVRWRRKRSVESSIHQMFIWLVVEPTHLKNMSQNGNHFPKLGMKYKKYLSCHHPVILCITMWNDQCVFSHVRTNYRNSSLPHCTSLAQRSRAAILWAFRQEIFHSDRLELVLFTYKLLPRKLA